MKDDTDIDFVVTWVDSSDPEWQKKFAAYRDELEGNKEICDIRYKEHNTLRYWFRGVEKFAPWVRKIHFITNGQYPAWLNLNHPKLHFVRHEDYIDRDYLPLFNSHSIENNLHRIQGLSEKFVYFNDDVFVISQVNSDFFFRNGLPCDSAILTIPPRTLEGAYMNAISNDLKLINMHFNRREVISRNILKWFNPKYGVRIICPPRLLSLNTKFTWLKNPHTAQPYLKSTFNEVWRKCAEYLTRTNYSRFRTNNDVSHLLFRYWQLAEGNFYPTYLRKGHPYFLINEDLPKILGCIKNHSAKVICINDAPDSEQKYTMLCIAFKEELGKISDFELF